MCFIYKVIEAKIVKVLFGSHSSNLFSDIVFYIDIKIILTNLFFIFLFNECWFFLCQLSSGSACYEILGSVIIVTKIWIYW